MTYATKAQLIDRYGARLLIDLTDRGDVATGAVVDSVIDRALADTDATIDGYLSAYYELPLSTTPPLIADLAQAIAIYKLHTFEPNDKIKADHAQAIATLKDIARGLVKIDAPGITPSTSGAGDARVTDRERPMTAENLKGFI